MAVRPILKFPDPLLRQTALPVTAFDAALKALADDLVDTMRAAPALGITGPHIGEMLRIVAIDLDDGAGTRLYVNPEILSASQELARHPEGSVSMPGVSDEIERPARVRVRWQDLTGATHEAEADGFLATCIQHEIDQLDGIFWIQRLSRLKRDRLVKRYEKLQRGY